MAEVCEAGARYCPNVSRTDDRDPHRQECSMYDTRNHRDERMIAHSNGAICSRLAVIADSRAVPCDGRAGPGGAGADGGVRPTAARSAFRYNPIEAAADCLDMQTILVIDDDESLRDTIGVLLEQEGFRAVLVADGRAGFEKALLLKPDLVLAGLRLPGMTGVEICKQLRGAN